MEFFKREPRTLEARLDDGGTAVVDKGEASAEDVRKLQLGLTLEQEAVLVAASAHEYDELRSMHREQKERMSTVLTRAALRNPLYD